eukprot:357002-Chlamydomonas_euryale.AAC.7
MLKVATTLPGRSVDSREAKARLLALHSSPDSWLYVLLRRVAYSIARTALRVGTANLEQAIDGMEVSSAVLPTGIVKRAVLCCSWGSSKNNGTSCLLLGLPQE